MADYHKKYGSNEKVLTFLDQALVLKDSLMKSNNLKQIAVLGAVYENGKQQQEIFLLQQKQAEKENEVKQQSFLNKVFAAAIIVLLLVGYLVFSNFRKGQQLVLQQQSIQAQHALLAGQEAERGRIAKELHDGLGSLLSGTKLSFLHVKEILPMAPPQKMLFEKSLSMLDNSMGDLRKIAQNLMPEALEKLGLSEALTDYCDTIQTASGISVLYQHYGYIRPMDKTVELYIYRIVQELVNNAVKYAEASQVIVQFTMHPGQVNITVEDNGKGFDKKILEEGRGTGYANIGYRVKYLNGQYDLLTSPGNGTSIHLELKTA